MTDPAQAAPAAAAPRRTWMQFTYPGCRTELRVGVLLLLSGTFLWNFAGPALAIKLALAGAPLLAFGAVMQALGTPRSYPWKLAVAMLALGLPMCWDFRFRDDPSGELQLLLVGPLLAGAGAWLALWWLVAAMRRPAPVEAA